MKTYLIIAIIVFCISQQLYSQNVEIGLVPENVETLISNTENIITDPSIISNNSDYSGVLENENKLFNQNPELDNNETESSIFNNMNIYAELGISKTSKFVKIPIAYYYKNFDLSLAMPFYIQRQVYYSHGYVSTYGLGDLLLSLSWKINTQNIYNKISANISFPTGNENKTVDGYLCPLGTGSKDLIFSNIFQYHNASYGINNNLSYRYSGESHKSVMINHSAIPGSENIYYSIRNGHLISNNTSYNYNFTNYFTLYGGISLLWNSDGTYNKEQTYTWKDDIIISDNNNAYQNMFLADLKLAFAFCVFQTDLVFVLSQPVYTRRALGNIEINRGFSYYLRLSRNIF